MDTNNKNATGNADKVQQPIQGQRPVGNRPSGLRPAGAQPIKPAGQVQRPVRPAGQMHNSPNSTSQASPVGQAKPRQAVGQPGVKQGAPVQQAPKPQTDTTKQDKTSAATISGGKNQRVIESKHIEFTKDTNKKDYVLYMIIDKPIDGMLQYFRSYGLNVSKIFSNIADARNALMMQVNPARIVIVDTGNGSFNSMSARKQVIDIMGLGDDENKITIFYSDTNLKSEIEASKEIQKKALTWYKYKTTAHLLACMLQSKDCNYISDGGYRDASPIVSSLDQTFWKNINFKDTEEHNSLPIINSSDISKLVHDPNAEEIRGFNPILR